MANAPVLKTGVRKDLGVRIPRPPLSISLIGRAESAAFSLARHWQLRSAQPPLRNTVRRWSAAPATNSLWTLLTMPP